MSTLWPAQGLLGQYFVDRVFAELGDIRVDPRVDFNWGTGSPSAGKVPTDRFTVRWSGQIKAPATGTFNFFTMSDDGVRLWINNTLVINNWTDHGAREDRGSIALVANQSCDIRLEYYDNTGKAQISLAWQPPGQPKAIVPATVLTPKAVPSSPDGTGTGLLAQYYGTKTLTDLAALRTDATVNFNWGAGSPDPAVPVNNFSARWTGQVQPRYSAPTRFTPRRTTLSACGWAVSASA